MWLPKTLVLFVGHFFLVGSLAKRCTDIDQEISLTVSAGDKITLTCFVKTDYKYHKWYADDPLVNINGDNDDLSISSALQRDDYQIQRRQFDEQLKLGNEEVVLYNITYAYVGKVRCNSYNYNVDDSRNYNGDDDCISKRYVLYVRDENILSLVNNRTYSADVIMDFDYLEIKYIPCIPTEPNVTVEIFVGKSIDPESQEKAGDNDCLRNLRGFPIDDLKLCQNESFDLSGVNFYTCKFRRNFKENSLQSRIVLAWYFLTSQTLSRVNIISQNIIGEPLLLQCNVDTEGINVTIEWLTPHTKNTDGHVKYFSKKNKTKIISWLSISEMNALDKGFYYCIVRYEDDYEDKISQESIFISTHHVQHILTRGKTEIDLFSAGGVTVKWHVSFNGDPEHYLYWLKDGNPLPIEYYFSKIFTNFSTSEATFLMMNVSETDFGVYTLVASKNGKISEELNINFPKEKFNDVAQTIAVTDIEKGLIKCVGVAYPELAVNWKFATVSFWDQIENFRFWPDFPEEFAPLKESFSEKNGLQVISYLTINSSWQGILECETDRESYEIQYQNIIGKNIQFQLFALKGVHFRKLDKIQRIEIFDTSEDGEMRLDSNLYEYLSLVCAVSTNNYSENIKWFHNDKLMKDSTRNDFIHNFNAVYIHWTAFVMHEISYDQSGYYKCASETKNGASHSQTIKITVGENYSSPNIIETNLVADMEISLHNKFRLYCEVAGYPTPRVLWLKDNITLQKTDAIKFINYNQTLLFENFTRDDVGLYRCEVFNSEGRDFKESNIKLTSTWLRYVWYIFSALLLLLVLISIFTIIKMRTAKNLQEKLKQIGLDNFEKGNLDKLDPELQLSEQADLLPYDRSWEVSTKKIKLGKKLGSGAFGIVLKGEMEDRNGKNIAVAVKTVKESTDLSSLKALASELKIMIHLGVHANIVNLIGACTKDIVNRELLVIVEYCSLGNIQCYLQHHKNNYIDQVNIRTGQVDYSIGENILHSVSPLSRGGSKAKSAQIIKYSTLLFDENSCSSVANPEEVPDDEEDVQASHYLGDYKKDVTPILTKDLIAWGMQTAMGMEYLSSRKVLHGDLAARNILLTATKVVKICDFGLANHMYHDYVYTKKEQVPLPVKWMAIESISSRIFSTQSDVWSFGIVLWEFFSLGDTPYPLMRVNQAFFKKLVAGYRMESPKFAPSKLYKIMLDCWQVDPSTRPSFTELADRIGSMLDESDKNHYLDMMNNSYMDLRSQIPNIDRDNKDYTAMVKAPNFESDTIACHDYVNSPTSSKVTSRNLPTKAPSFQISDSALESCDNPSYCYSSESLTKKHDVIDDSEATYL